MQSSTERDEYVEIVWDKIQRGTESNFDAYGDSYIMNYNVEYDYGSVMHYGATSFSIDGSDTIIAKKDLNGQTMGQRLRLSTNDIARVNRMYCDEPWETTTSRPTSPPRPPPTLPSIPEFAKSIHQFVNNILRNIFGSLRPS